MSSGRRETVLLLCPSVLKHLYLPSLQHYDADRIFVFLNSSDDSVSSFEKKLYFSEKENIDCVNITELSLDTHDFEEMLGIITDICNNITAEFGMYADIFVNITSGTHEFAAAGMFASMMLKNVTAFNVKVVDNTFDENDIEEIVSRLEGRIKFDNPSRVSILQNQEPDDEMIAFLRVVDDIMKTTRLPKYSVIIERLKEAGAWTYDEGRKINSGRTPLKQKEERYLVRHYLTTALENGWIERPSSNTMKITEKGATYLDVFGREAIPAPRMSAGKVLKCLESVEIETGGRVYDMGSPGLDQVAPSYSGNVSSSRSDSVGPSYEENVVSFERNGKTYRFRIGQE